MKKNFFNANKINFNNIRNTRIGRLLNNKICKIYRRLSERPLVATDIVNEAATPNIPR